MSGVLTTDEAIDLAFLLGADRHAVGIAPDGQVIVSGAGDRRRIAAKRLQRFEAQGWLRRASGAIAFWRLTPAGFSALSAHFATAE